MKSIEFNNFTEFYNFLVDNNIEDTPVTAEFKRLVEQINVGCGCGKKNRIKNVQTFFIFKIFKICKKFGISKFSIFQIF